MAPKDCFLGAVRRRTMICCRNVKISASIAARDRNRSTTAHTMSLTRSLITDQHQHRLILGQPPAIIATGTAGAIFRSATSGQHTLCRHADPMGFGDVARRSRILQARRRIELSTQGKSSGLPITSEGNWPNNSVVVAFVSWIAVKSSLHAHYAALPLQHSLRRQYHPT